MEAESGQPYAYAAGSPLNYVDPSGNIAWFVAFAMFVGANIATDIAIDVVFNGTDIGTAFWNGVGNLGNYIPVPGVGKVSTVTRLAAKGAARNVTRRIADTASRYGGTKLEGEGNYHFPTRRAARQAASEILVGHAANRLAY